MNLGFLFHNFLDSNIYFKKFIKHLWRNHLALRVRTVNVKLIQTGAEGWDRIILCQFNVVVCRRHDGACPEGDSFTFLLKFVRRLWIASMGNGGRVATSENSKPC